MQKVFFFPIGRCFFFQFCRWTDDFDKKNLKLLQNFEAAGHPKKERDGRHNQFFRCSSRPVFLGRVATKVAAKAVAKAAAKTAAKAAAKTAATAATKAAAKTAAKAAATAAAKAAAKAPAKTAAKAAAEASAKAAVKATQQMFAYMLICSERHSHCIFLFVPPTLNLPPSKLHLTSRTSHHIPCLWHQSSDILTWHPYDTASSSIRTHCVFTTYRSVLAQCLNDCGCRDTIRVFSVTGSRQQFHRLISARSTRQSSYSSQLYQIRLQGRRRRFLCTLQDDDNNACSA